MTAPSLSQQPVFSRLILGIWRIASWGKTPSQVADLVAACLDLGIDTFDLADIYADYQCEAQFGAALQTAPALHQRIKLISKCGIGLISPARPAHRVKHYNTTGEHIVSSVENSLTNLGAEALDLLLIHRPDPLMDADEVAEAFRQLKAAGKVQRFGVSNFLPHQVSLLQSRMDEPLAVNQIEISLLHSQPMFDGSLDHCQQHHIAPQAWSPLGGGRLTGLDATHPLAQTLAEQGEALNASAEQLAIAWLLQHPSRIHPVLGSGKIERIEALAQAQNLTLDRQQWFALLEAVVGHSVA